MDDTEARDRLLDTAEALFYARGVQAVGMDEIRTASGVPLKRLYRVFPAKADLVAAYLARRDGRWIGDLRAAAAEAPDDPLRAVFDWLADWFREPGFRGCAFVNAFGELGHASDAVVDIVRGHKRALREVLGEVADHAGGGTELADQLVLLVEGAITTAALDPGPEPARSAYRAAVVLATTAKGTSAAT
ncbi:TetR/AcrR family transcriptional regulator [Yinghuangia sp. YIM S09857]|uniref:TetR/AcrR family transcriptional regulator n=1 Tax=Yinghuangia sp. YIM S09857 TaxID=3436929 RepID=UPI003F52A163